MMPIHRPLIWCALALLTLTVVLDVSRPMPPAGAAESVKLDKFGGLPVKIDAPASNFRTKKVGQRWYFVTPEGNAFWLNGVFSVVALPRVGKHRDRPDAANQTVIRMKSWGFNTLAEYAGGYELTSPERTPFVAMFKPVTYGLSQGRFKNLMTGLSKSYTGWRAECPDVFDPSFPDYVAQFVAGTVKDQFWGGQLGTPWHIGTTIDDSDYLFGFSAGPDLPAVQMHPHIGWMVLATAPTQASSTAYKVNYKDQVVHSRTALLEQLRTKYRTIEALNTAWRSKYTRFESDGGWGRGTGLADEDGRNRAWLGGSEGTLVGASPAVVADLNAFLETYAERYFSVTTREVRKALPKTLIFSPATLNGWGGITRKEILGPAGKYVDVLNARIQSQTILEHTIRFAGDRPIVTWEGYVANPDSALSGTPNPSWTTLKTQAERGAAYVHQLGFLSSVQTSSGLRPIAGQKLWAWNDHNGEMLNWGLVTMKDNAYDGKEARVAAGKDPWGYLTGGEAGDYGDFITPVKQANQQLYQRLYDELRARK